MTTTAWLGIVATPRHAPIRTPTHRLLFPVDAVGVARTVAAASERDDALELGGIGRGRYLTIPDAECLHRQMEDARTLSFEDSALYVWRLSPDAAVGHALSAAHVYREDRSTVWDGYYRGMQQGGLQSEAFSPAQLVLLLPLLSTSEGTHKSFGTALIMAREGR